VVMLSSKINTASDDFPQRQTRGQDGVLLNLDSVQIPINRGVSSKWVPAFTVPISRIRQYFRVAGDTPRMYVVRTMGVIACFRPSFGQLRTTHSSTLWVDFRHDSPVTGRLQQLPIPCQNLMRYR
jgi:hypothetical protein